LPAADHHDFLLEPTLTAQPYPDVVLAMLANGEWTLTRSLTDPSMTDEYQARTAWCVGRQVAPFGDPSGTRVWFGPTAHAALVAAQKALFGDTRPLPEPASRGQLIETQLMLYFTVGPDRGEDDEISSGLQTRSYNALNAIYLDRGLAALGVGSEGFTYVPVGLCECEWDGQVVDGQSVYSVAFHSESAIDAALAAKLRAMALEAYTKVCGPEARFIRAELYQKWAQSERALYQFVE
jgi:hypothetical protein